MSLKRILDRGQEGFGPYPSVNIPPEKVKKMSDVDMSGWAGFAEIGKKKRGRPKGSKNKTKKRTAKRRGPGRPKGSKNKKRTSLKRRAVKGLTISIKTHK